METIPIVIAFKTLVLRREPNYICKNKGNPETLEKEKKNQNQKIRSSINIASLITCSLACTARKGGATTYVNKIWGKKKELRYKNLEVLKYH